MPSDKASRFLCQAAYTRLWERICCAPRRHLQDLDVQLSKLTSTLPWAKWTKWVHHRPKAVWLLGNERNGPAGFTRLLGNLSRAVSNLRFSQRRWPNELPGRTRMTQATEPLPRFCSSGEFFCDPCRSDSLGNLSGIGSSALGTSSRGLLRQMCASRTTWRPLALNLVSRLLEFACWSPRTFSFDSDSERCVSSRYRNIADTCSFHILPATNRPSRCHQLFEGDTN